MWGVFQCQHEICRFVYDLKLWNQKAQLHKPNRNPLDSPSLNLCIRRETGKKLDKMKSNFVAEDRERMAANHWAQMAVSDGIGTKRDWPNFGTFFLFSRVKNKNHGIFKRCIWQKATFCFNEVEKHTFIDHCFNADFVERAHGSQLMPESLRLIDTQAFEQSGSFFGCHLVVIASESLRKRHGQIRCLIEFLKSLFADNPSQNLSEGG